MILFMLFRKKYIKVYVYIYINKMELKNFESGDECVEECVEDCVNDSDCKVSGNKRKSDEISSFMNYPPFKHEINKYTSDLKEEISEYQNEIRELKIELCNINNQIKDLDKLSNFIYILHFRVNECTDYNKMIKEIETWKEINKDSFYNSNIEFNGTIKLIDLNINNMIMKLEKNKQKYAMNKSISNIFYSSVIFIIIILITSFFVNIFYNLLETNI